MKKRLWSVLSFHHSDFIQVGGYLLAMWISLAGVCSSVCLLRLSHLHLPQGWSPSLSPEVLLAFGVSVAGPSSVTWGGQMNESVLPVFLGLSTLMVSLTALTLCSHPISQTLVLCAAGAGLAVTWNVSCASLLSSQVSIPSAVKLLSAVSGVVTIATVPILVENVCPWMRESVVTWQLILLAGLSSLLWLGRARLFPGPGRKDGLKDSASTLSCGGSSSPQQTRQLCWLPAITWAAGVDTTLLYLACTRAPVHDADLGSAHLVPADEKVVCLLQMALCVVCQLSHVCSRHWHRSNWKTSLETRQFNHGGRGGHCTGRLGLFLLGSAGLTSYIRPAGVDMTSHHLLFLLVVAHVTPRPFVTWCGQQQQTANTSSVALHVVSGLAVSAMLLALAAPLAWAVLCVCSGELLHNLCTGSGHLAVSVLALVIGVVPGLAQAVKVSVNFRCPGMNCLLFTCAWTARRAG